MKHKKKSISFSIFFLSIFIAITSGLSKNERGDIHLQKSTSDDPPNVYWVRHDVGTIGMAVSNMGLFGGQGGYEVTDQLGNVFYGCEYPIGSNTVFLAGGGIYIGAIVNGDTMVSSGYYEAGAHCFYARRDPRVDSILTIPNYLEIHPEVDPEKLDVDTIKIITNVEGYANYSPDAISEQDIILQYRDDWWPVAEHYPMHVKVLQTSYAWSYSYCDDFIYFNYKIINQSQNKYEKTYIGFFSDADVGNMGAIEVPSFGDICWYDRNTKLSVMQDADGDEGMSEGFIGYRIIDVPGGPDAIDNLDVSWVWWGGWKPPWTISGNPDPDVYEVMSSNYVWPNQEPSEATDTRFLVSFGPWDIEPNDTLNFTIAVIAGEDKDQLLFNAKWAKDLFDMNFLGPEPPPPPPLEITSEYGKVVLDWKWHEGDEGENPELCIDRISNVNDFQGYRVYKSSNEAGPFTLLAEYDLPDDDYGFNTGLEYTYIDSGLVSAAKYYYAVTSFDIGDSSRGVEPLESGIRKNLTAVTPTVQPQNTLDNVIVVPNPYLGNIDYTQVGRWEGIERGFWTESDRKIAFFNVPEKCTIRIFTLAGDLVDTIYHDDPNSGIATWNLISKNNQAIVSGLYLFVIEDSKGNKKIGKFMVIK